MENLKVKDWLKDLCIDGRIVGNMVLKEIGWESVGWIQLVHDRYQ
jgi:hypothetical protein